MIRDVLHQMRLNRGRGSGYPFKLIYDHEFRPVRYRDQPGFDFSTDHPDGAAVRRRIERNRVDRERRVGEALDSPGTPEYEAILRRIREAGRSRPAIRYDRPPERVVFGPDGWTSQRGPEP